MSEVEIIDGELLSHVVINVRKAAGYYVPSSGLKFGIEKKPSAWHRFWVRVILGWQWEE